MRYSRFTKLGYESSNSLEWITQVVHRRVQHLDLQSRGVPRRLGILPQCVYVSKTLVSLKLVYIWLKDPKFDVSLPCLKIMHLENNYFLRPNNTGFAIMDYLCGDGHLIMKKLISGSPWISQVVGSILLVDREKHIWSTKMYKTPSLLILRTTLLSMFYSMVL
ncbi:unnamed protein product [Eruca vesicaria subsp. sativa]|uniref:Uncharacterized protein n=1 Tax=Eruca vesicaria subsp. sativa TaxID=29727 RepID=A0ABC8LS85_ERUVS|nr:unnamed protein product [Eruca vesicaria subsp. sativa]